MALTLLVDQLREDLELLVVVGAGRLLQRLHGQRVKEVLLTILAPLVLATRCQGRFGSHPLGIGLGMTAQKLFGNAVQIDAADA